MELTKNLIIGFLKGNTLMTVATYGDHPWIASVYYSFDNELNLFFLSNPATLHCKQIAENPNVAVSIADSHQKTTELKKGLQLYGQARLISDVNKIRHALRLWKDFLQVKDAQLTVENMFSKLVTGRMYQIIPKKIKFFNQELFKVTDGQEPVLEL